MKQDYMVVIRFSVPRLMAVDELENLERDLAAQVEEPQGILVTSNVSVAINEVGHPYEEQN